MRRALSILLAMSVVLAGVVSPAQAEVSWSITDNVLTVQGADEADYLSITVECFGSDVTVNGDYQTTNFYPCEDVTSIVINLGGGDDFFTGLREIRADEWPALTGIHVNGEDGDDYVEGSAINDTLSGGPGNDFVPGYLGPDIMHGGPGRDELSAYGPYDWTLTPTTLVGDAIDQHDGFEMAELTLSLEGPSHTIDASTFAGDVEVQGSEATDTIITGPGNDRINPWEGADTIDAGAGTDTIEVDNGNYDFRVVTLTSSHLDVSADGSEHLMNVDLSQFERARIDAEWERQVVDTSGFQGPTEVDLGPDRDTFFGGSGRDIVHGEGGPDSIKPGAGGDVAYGDKKDDKIDGGPGNDICVGGQGDDSIRFCEDVTN